MNIHPGLKAFLPGFAPQKVIAFLPGFALQNAILTGRTSTLEE